MPAPTSAEKGIRELRSALSEVVNDAAVRGRITYITSHGRRVAAVVPVPVAEDVEAGATLRGLRRYVEELRRREQKPDIVRQLRIIEEAIDAAERRAAES
ncbi:type II toxin-antitoxin system prevent-host-death family antitoxin [Streptomyces sp. ALI-76-A]|uniref:type II toxin-antitoxin system prevent-host-death family antitoxin n=1 Tax=Streptomyces sp. ALI-76-A TaxID=3025736 RepID=UPI00256F5F19|nr:type II toxin-antitoxin system prevent-host-death family antitoxin [Streptomyces sp. ALI-76-A]MDL5205092.1 type II toxin-antitoxin system prevent-host-death family antitoxin [Streptomyces sp. ALI-76-A]